MQNKRRLALANQSEPVRGSASVQSVGSTPLLCPAGIIDTESRVVT